MLKDLYRRKHLFFGILFLTKFVSQAAIADMINVPFKALVEGADHIVVGRVKQIRGENITNETGDRFIVSVITLKVEENLESQLPALVEVRSVGGAIGDKSDYLSISAVFHEGETVLLFLESRPRGILVPYQFYQGKYVIKDGFVLGVEGQDRSLQQIRNYLVNGKFESNQKKEKTLHH